MKKSEAIAYRRKIERAAEAQTDEAALESIELFPKFKDLIGQWVELGKRLSFQGKLYKVIQPHTTQADWTPDITPALFVEVSIEEWPEIPEVITAENAFMSGDKGTWKGQHYICQMDNCVWNPDQYPAAWQLVG